jgi:pSer/pThr/pTyr-binding forkhead associated (FHA) protein
MKARLAIYKGAKLDMAFPLTESLTAIGRDFGNIVQLSEPQISKRHAAIHAAGGAWTIEDLNSTNGVAINGAKINQRTLLKNGDRIRLGPRELVFETIADSTEWVPGHVIDMSSKAELRTVDQTIRPKS